MLYLVNAFIPYRLSTYQLKLANTQSHLAKISLVGFVYYPTHYCIYANITQTK